MRSIRRSGITALTAAIALALGAVPAGGFASGLFAAGEDETRVVTPSTAIFDGGTLTLSTALNSSGAWESNVAWSQDDTLQQTLTEGASYCQLSSSGHPLLDIKGFVGQSQLNTATFRGGSIGVGEDSKSAVCNRVDAINFEEFEKLQLTLGQDRRASQLVASSGTLDIDMRARDVRILATMWSEANTFLAAFELRTGRTLTTATPLTIPTGDGATTYTIPTENLTNEPRAGQGANVSWPIVAPLDNNGKVIPFAKLILEARNGAFALHGGQESGTPTSFEVLTEPDGALDCGDTVTRSAEAMSSDALRNVTITRLENAGSESGACATIPYLFSKAGNFTDFLKPLDQEVTAQFVFDFSWTVPADIDPTGDTAGTALLPRTLVDFDGDGSDSNAPVAIAWCPDLVEETILVAGQPKTYMVVKDIGTNEFAKDQADNYPADDPLTSADEDTKQFACLVSQSSEVRPGEVQGADVLTVEEQIYVYGDIRLLK